MPKRARKRLRILRIAAVMTVRGLSGLLRMGGDGTRSIIERVYILVLRLYHRLQPVLILQATGTRGRVF